MQSKDALLQVVLLQDENQAKIRKVRVIKKVHVSDKLLLQMLLPLHKFWKPQAKSDPITRTPSGRKYAEKTTAKQNSSSSG